MSIFLTASAQKVSAKPMPAETKMLPVAEETKYLTNIIKFNGRHRLCQTDIKFFYLLTENHIFLYSLSDKSLLIPRRVEPGYSKRAKIELCKIYSIRALHTSCQIFLKTPIKPEAIKCLYSGATCSIALKAIGNFRSDHCEKRGDK